MKAKYQQPATDIVAISLSQMIAVSGEGTGGVLPTDGNPTTIDLGNTGSTDKKSGNLSRRTVWDDEENEDY